MDSTRLNEIDDLCVNTIRMLAIDGVEKAKSGHPGAPLGDAAMAYALWTRHMRHNPANPAWPNRDRFVLSAGHASMLLYSLLHLTGYKISIDDLKNFRQWGSITPGHPEYHIESGIETTTGPLGQGFATGVGMAMAQKYLAGRFNRDDHKLFDYHIYGILSDGDLMEGVASESASLAGHLGLGQIIYLYSDNHITIDGTTDISFTEDRGKRFEAYGWHVQKVDGNDVDAVDRAIAAAKNETSRPSIIVARTHIGFGCPNKQDSPDAHGSPLGSEEISLVKECFGWPVDNPFYVPDEAAAHFRKAGDAGSALESGWRSMADSYAVKYPELGSELAALVSGKLPANWEAALPVFDASAPKIATRSASGKVLNAIAPKLPTLLGGSADLAASNNTDLKGMGEFADSPAGRNIRFGVREHGMAAACNGMSLSGLIPYCATFLVFSDYMRPSIRLSAIMGQRVVYILTHDSIGLGEDGPTHQPVEHVASLRAMPNLDVIRPADANEVAEAWRMAINRTDGPTALILTRQNLPILDRTKYAPASGTARGAYVLAEPADGAAPKLIIISSGSEVHLALAAQERLASEGIPARVVNMVCQEAFERQSAEYRSEVLPPSIGARIVVEAGATFGWERYTCEKGDIIGIDRFGASAPGNVVMEKLGFSVDNVVSRAKAVLGN